MESAASKFKLLFPTTRAEIKISFYFFVLYFITAFSSYYVYSTFKTSPAIFWPPVGFGLAATILFGYRMWLPILLGQFIGVVALSPSSPLLLFVSSIGYASQAVIAAYALNFFGFTPEMERLRSVLMLVLLSFFVSMLAPAITSIFQYIYSAFTLNPILSFTRVWSAGLFSILIFTPFVFTWYPIKSIKLESPRNELFLAFLILIAVDHFVLWTPYGQYLGISVIFFIPAVLIWFALRLHPRWLSLALLFTSIYGVAGAIIAHPSPTPLNTQLLNLEIYLGMVAAIFIVFAAVVEERRIAYSSLEKAYEVASAADKAKNEFIAILAHELRNPLAPIVTSLELLKLQPQTQEATETIKNAEQHAVMIRRLLDDLLDTARLAQKKFQLQKTTVSLREVVTQSVASVRDVIALRRHTLSVTLPDTPIEMFADPVRIKQILINLLNNAAKYTEPRGTVELIAQKKGNELVITVKDNGIGIDPELMPSLFEPFKQLSPFSRASSGLGIGLFLTQRLAEMHGGSIQAESGGLGKGSKFIFRLPIPAQSPSIETKKIEESIPLQRNTVKRILIADDNEAAVNGLQKLLHYRGYEVEVAYTGYSTLEKIKEYRPEVIILDIGMPDMSGYDVAKEIRKKGWGGKLIALTGYGQDTDKQHATEAGFDHHLVKPVSINDIEKVL